MHAVYRHFKSFTVYIQNFPICRIKDTGKVKKIQYNEHTLSTSSKNAQTNISLTLNSFASYNLSLIHYWFVKKPLSPFILHS